MTYPLIYEAQLIGFKEGLKTAVVWLVFYSYLVTHDRRGLIKWFYASVLTALVLSLIASSLPSRLITVEHLNNIIVMSFALFLLSSGAALLHFSGVNLFGFLHAGSGEQLSSVTKAGGGLEQPGLWKSLVCAAALLFFLPDITASLFFLRDLSFMKETVALTYVSAVAGAVIGAAIVLAVVKLYKPYGIGSLFDVPQLLLFLAMVKLLGSGTAGIAELSLIPSVQRGFMKFAHDFIHQTLVIFMVPDHPLLKTTVWNFIGIFFGSNLASIVALLMLLFFPIMFLYHSLVKPLPGIEAVSNVQRRKIKARMLSDKRKKAVPVFVFIILILASWFLQTGEQISRIYIPKPRPVVEDRGMVMIPLHDPTMNVMDGSLHTFSLIHEGEEMRLLVMKKSDNSLSVCLDACEICPPEGYGLREDHVVCLYCQTPIHIDTLGKPGGCNPIPLSAEIDGRFVRIEMKEILKKWGFIQPGSGREGGQ